MIRDRLKSAARKAAIRVLGMEFDAEDKVRSAHQPPQGASRYDESKIPKVVDGSGDTPGPNHKEDVGRPYVSAQLTGGVAPVFIDVRQPDEVAAGLLPGALLLPGDLVKQHLDLLPTDKTERITVYDQTGAQGSAELAAWLREQGWGWARRLRGGYAEWIEHGEQVQRPTAPKGGRHKLGDPARLADGREGWIIRALATAEGPRYTVWLQGGITAGPLGEDALSS